MNYYKSANLLKNKKILIALMLLMFCSFMNFAQNNSGDSDSVNYRGKRELKDSGSFSVLNISTARSDSASVRFDILFNQAINPDSVSKAAFYINGNKTAVNGKTEFSKDGKKIRVILDVSAASFSFEISGIQSYNGKVLDKVKTQLKDNGEVRLSSE